LNPAGVLLSIIGIWVLCQVIGGKALQRLGVIPDEPILGGD